MKQVNRYKKISLLLGIVIALGVSYGYVRLLMIGASLVSTRELSGLSSGFMALAIFGLAYVIPNWVNAFVDLWELSLMILVATFLVVPFFRSLHWSNFLLASIFVLHAFFQYKWRKEKKKFLNKASHDKHTSA